MTLLEEIQYARTRLDEELSRALSTMEKSDRVKEIRFEIKQNQNRCPHIENFEVCPYCGKKVSHE